ncbi:KDO2-lipid IV(A) lauroyltransferase [Humitalea rosea]|uniref:KDO2-lipid IV(A) lauroyltransferase n=1 Tax=Humitalea rosea TaxID=990373 RepID=A0A2W7ILZ6_9PROT|nr:lauroyl acyltransferase [Humitalea rosea]PZW47121.1 KDO2-lipid IV(A) lauroyltransferase [Humitalea rosea]
MRRVTAFWQALPVRAALRVARLLGPVRASNVFGALARWLGPLLPVSRIARVNLRLALPGADHAAILAGMWENLGRLAGEAPHLAGLRETASGPGWEILGAEHLPVAGPAILVSAHIGNWEVLPTVLAARGLPVASLYRAPDNPVVGRILRRLRGGGPALLPKGGRGALAAARHLARGGMLGLLADQKLNEGLAIPFFGRPAMTTPAPAILARRFACPLVPGRVQRLGPARFRILVEPALPPDPDPAVTMTAVNARIEAWVRERPEEWLWLHRRWPKALYRLDG